MPKFDVQQKLLSILVQFVKLFVKLSIIVLRSRTVMLRGKRSVLDALILLSNSLLGIVIARLICIAVSVLL